MRILGMNEMWDKLISDTFTTFRFPRKDRDWKAGNIVQIVYKPRSRKDDKRAVLGIAEIIGKYPRWVISPTEVHMISDAINSNLEWDNVPIISEEEAQLDGFDSRESMIQWIIKAHGARNFLEPMNKLRIRWNQIWLWHPKYQAPDTMKEWARLHLKQLSHDIQYEAGLK